MSRKYSLYITYRDRKPSLVKAIS
jgi:DNA replication licensing factor MCM7